MYRPSPIPPNAASAAATKQKYSILIAPPRCSASGGVLADGTPGSSPAIPVAHQIGRPAWCQATGGARARWSPGLHRDALFRTGGGCLPFVHLPRAGARPMVAPIITIVLDRHSAAAERPLR